MILIADCGSTKIDWCLLKDNKLVKQVFTGGINAVLLTREEIIQRLEAELVPELAAFLPDIRRIHFYGAGCFPGEISENMATALKSVLTAATEVEVNTDLLGAARALCGHEPGIACIMGTGSNSCYYDGREIVDNVSPLGYILGDEGSGAVLGKVLVGDILKKQLPEDLCAAFLEQYGLDRMTIIRRVYKEPQPNRFLASLSPFLCKNIGRPEIHALVKEQFRRFFIRNVAAYGCPELPVSFVGSIAAYYTPVLAEAAAETGFILGKIIQSPMEGLISFHTA